jgi:hypothetical protein
MGPEADCLVLAEISNKLSFGIRPHCGLSEHLNNCPQAALGIACLLDRGEYSYQRRNHQSPEASACGTRSLKG